MMSLRSNPTGRVRPVDQPRIGRALGATLLGLCLATLGVLGCKPSGGDGRPPAKDAVAETPVEPRPGSGQPSVAAAGSGEPLPAKPPRARALVVQR